MRNGVPLSFAGVPRRRLAAGEVGGARTARPAGVLPREQPRRRAAALAAAGAYGTAAGQLCQEPGHGAAPGPAPSHRRPGALPRRQPHQETRRRTQPKT